MLCTAQGEIPSAQAEELFGKVLKVLDNHKSGWARAVGRLEEGLRRAGVALGECLTKSFWQLSGAVPCWARDQSTPDGHSDGVIGGRWAGCIADCFRPCRRCILSAHGTRAISPNVRQHDNVNAHFFWTRDGARPLTRLCTTCCKR